MRYERHIEQFDNIVAIEEVDEATFSDRRFHRKIDGMETVALEEIDLMVEAAKYRVLDKSSNKTRDPMRLSKLFGQIDNLAWRQSMAAQSLNQLAAQQNVASSPCSGLLSGVFGMWKPF